MGLEHSTDCVRSWRAGHIVITHWDRTRGPRGHNYLTDQNGVVFKIPGTGWLTRGGESSVDSILWCSLIILPHHRHRHGSGHSGLHEHQRSGQAGRLLASVLEIGAGVVFATNLHLERCLFSCMCVFTATVSCFSTECLHTALGTSGVCSRSCSVLGVIFGKGARLFGGFP